MKKLWIKAHAQGGSNGGGTNGNGGGNNQAGVDSSINNV